MSDRDIQIAYDNRQEPDPDERNWREIPSRSMLICAWCKEIMREGEEPASHGICPACAKVEMRKAKALIKELL